MVMIVVGWGACMVRAELPVVGRQDTRYHITETPPITLPHIYKLC